MTQLILAYNFPAKHLAKLRMAAMKLGVKVRPVEKREYLPRCLRDMAELGERYGAHWLKAGKCSAKGHPHHPLYLRKDEKTEDFDILGYLDRL